VTIEGTVNGVPVTQIGTAAFRGQTSITAVSIPSTLQTINGQAFYEATSLATVTIGAGSALSLIEGTAFLGANLTSISIPAGVTSIGQNAFSYNRNLATVTFETGSVLSSIGDFAFDGDASLAGVTIPNNVTSVGNYAFRGTGLTSVTIGSGVTTLGFGAFGSATNLASVRFLGNAPTASSAFTLVALGAKAYRTSNLTGYGANGSLFDGLIVSEPPATPDAPTSLVATPGDGSVTIAFTAGADNSSAITNYEYSTDNGASWTARSPAATTSPIAISGLTNGTAYNVRLRAVNNVGAGAESSAVSVTPVDPTPPPTPTPTPKPAKPSAKWSSSAKKKTITAVITPVAGVTYTLTAKSGRKTKKGSCKNVTIKQGKKKLARRSCKIKLAKGKWLASVTPKKGSVSGTVNSKRYTFK
jgi:biotin carboxyl carrier protein